METTVPQDQACTLPALSPELAETWLAWQCRMVAGIIRGSLYPVTDSTQLGVALTVWPNPGEGQEQLDQAATMALAEGRGVLQTKQAYGPGKQRVCDLIATPLLMQGKPLAVVAVMVSIRSEPQQHAVMQLLQWGGVWLDTLANQQSRLHQESSNFTLALLSHIHGHANAHTAALETVNQLADRLGCERVSIGFKRGISVRLQVLSHAASFDARTQLVRCIEAAMEEALDQDVVLVYPQASEKQPGIHRAHSELAKQQGQGSLCTLPLPGRFGTIGALTLERAAEEPFDRETVAWCESLSRIIGPALDLKRREDRPFWVKGMEAMKAGLASVFGPAHLKLKLGLATAVVVFGLLAVMEGEHRVTAPAGIEGAVRQLLLAPQAGYVKEAQVRAGDLVTRDQLIATLEDRDLKLEYQKRQSEKNKVEKEYQEALAKRDRIQLSILNARLDQADAELRLVEEKLARTQLRSPFDGVVVSGDLSQSLGAPVEMGQLLFEVAPLDSYRVVLEVDEHDMAGIAEGRAGQLVIAALPQSRFPLTIDKVVPVAVSGEGRNYFRVEASLAEPSKLLRPGMQGVAKVEMGQRKLLWIWTHTLIDRLRLRIWSLGF